MGVLPSDSQLLLLLDPLPLHARWTSSGIEPQAGGSKQGSRLPCLLRPPAGLPGTPGEVAALSEPRQINWRSCDLIQSGDMIRVCGMSGVYV